MMAMGDRITVFLADDNLIVREGVRALLGIEPDLEVVGTAGDYDELVAGATAAAPQVLVTDIRMPPAFQREGIDAAKELRKRHPGTGVVVLSQYDDPEYAISLLADGAAGYAYLLKDRIAEGDQLARAVREVATGGSVLDPKIVEALVHPVAGIGGAHRRRRGAAAADRAKAGRSRRSPRRSTRRPPRSPSRSTACSSRCRKERARARKARCAGCACLHQAIVDREEQGETLSRLLPTGARRQAAPRGPQHRRDRRARRDRDHVRRARLLGDRRDDRSQPRSRDQLNEHRAEMNHAILDEDGTVMQFVGDAVMACFGAPVPQDDHADRAFAAGGRDAASARSSSTHVGRRGACRRSGSASACRPARSPRRCSDRRNASSTRWSAIP